MTTGSRSAYEHIVLDEDRVPWIEGANTKVVELVAGVKAHGWSPEEVVFQHPHLTLGQVYSALAFYWDHREEIDADLERRAAEVEEIRGEDGDHPLVAKLRAQGRLDSVEPDTALVSRPRAGERSARPARSAPRRRFGR